MTGANGFLGAAIARHLAAAGVAVHAFARTPPTLGIGIVGHGWDPTRDSAPPAPDLKVDSVIDCAAVLPSRERDPAVLRQVNAELAAGALDLAARGRGRLVYMSSQSVFGRPTVSEIDPTTEPAPDTPYGAAKLSGEQALAEAVLDGRLAGAVALRLPAVVGPGAHDNFPATVAARILRDETVTLFNPDGPYNAVVDVDTVASFAGHLTRSISGFHAVSLATAPPITVLQAVRAIAEGMGGAARTGAESAPHASPTIDPSAAAALGFPVESPLDVLRRFGRAVADRVSDIATPPSTR